VEDAQPEKPEKYDPSTLSNAEKNRFVAALGDGFGYSHRAFRSQRLNEHALPAQVEAGLLRHRVYYDKSHQPEYYDGDEADKFWEESDGDSPPGLFEQCPVNFDLAAIRQYFDAQKIAYLGHAKSQSDYTWLDRLEPEERANWDNEIYHRALDKTYSKAWYECHINEQIDLIEGFTAAGIDQPRSNARALVGLLVIQSSATLGRLIEQYYWKFLLEKAAMRGQKISEAAKSGGHLRAAIGKRDHAVWQSAARLVWQKDPKKSKMTVASIVKKRLNLDQSVKHISRTLSRP
jgi:hypothetical protein